MSITAMIHGPGLLFGGGGAWWLGVGQVQLVSCCIGGGACGNDGGADANDGMDDGGADANVGMDDGGAGSNDGMDDGGVEPKPESAVSLMLALQCRCVG